MANNEIVDSDTNCTKQTECFVYCNVPNATNEGLSTSENHKSVYKTLKYLLHSTVRKIQSRKKKFHIRKRSVSEPCKSKEIATCTSLSSIVDNIIKSDARTVAEIKQKVIDAIASTTQSGEVFDKVTCENLPAAVEHFVHRTPYRYAEYAAKYVDNAVLERGCGPLCISSGTQSDTVDGESSLETSPDAFAKACEKRRHADFILEKIAKVSDALTEKARLGSAKEQAVLASVSVTSTGYKIGEDEETFESTEPFKSSVIHAEKKQTAAAVADAAVTVMQPETLTDTQVLITPSKYLAPDSRDFSVCLGKSRDVPDIQIIPSIKKNKHTCTVSVMCSGKDDFRVTAVTRKKREEKSPKKISLRPTSDKHLLTVDKTSYAAVIIKCIPKLRKEKSLDQPDDIQTDATKQKATTVKNGIIDSSIETSQVEEKPTQIAKDIVQESMPSKYKKPKYPTKYRINGSYMMKEEKMSEIKEIPKDSEKIPKYACFFSPLPETTSRFATELYQDCRSRLPKYLQPVGYCEDLIPNIYFGRYRYCNIRTISCFSWQNEATQNATLSHVHRLLQDSCAIEYHASCHSLVDSHASFRYYNTNADCTKRRVTFENSLCTNTYCKSDAKYCYSHLNNIDNVRMGYYHYNDSCPVWNNQHCGRDRSYY